MNTRQQQGDPTLTIPPIRITWPVGGVDQDGNPKTDTVTLEPKALTAALSRTVRTETNRSLSWWINELANLTGLDFDVIGVVLWAARLQRGDTALGGNNPLPLSHVENALTWGDGLDGKLTVEFLDEHGNVLDDIDQETGQLIATATRDAESEPDDADPFDDSNEPN